VGAGHRHKLRETIHKAASDQLVSKKVRKLIHRSGNLNKPHIDKVMPLKARGSGNDETSCSTEQGYLLGS